jgi:hypothetical protein
MVFGFFKKKKEADYDPLNITVKDLKKGFVFEYDLRQWEVIGEYTYDWGDNYFSKEYRITDGRDTHFLSVEEDDEIEVVLYDKMKVSQIDGDIAGEIIKNQIPPAKVKVKGMTFRRENESPGYFKEESTDKDWVEFINWQYYDESEKHVLSIEQWEEKEFEASFGTIINDYEITNILPGNEP